MIEAFQGDLCDAAGRVVAPAGFMTPGTHGPFGGPVGPSKPIYLTRANAVPLSDASRDLMTRMDRAATFEEFQQQMAAQGRDIQRAEFMADPAQLAFHLGKTISQLERGISVSGMGYPPFPARENLEAESKILIPVETPVRNKLPREPGSGVSSIWRQTTSLGGGWLNDAFHSPPTPPAVDQPGGVPAVNSTTLGTPIQFFFSETGAPGQFASQYASKTAPYKLAGVFGSVTGFAMAAGAN